MIPEISLRSQPNCLLPQLRQARRILWIGGEVVHGDPFADAAIGVIRGGVCEQARQVVEDAHAGEADEQGLGQMLGPRFTQVPLQIQLPKPIDRYSVAVRCFQGQAVIAAVD